MFKRDGSERINNWRRYKNRWKMYFRALSNKEFLDKNQIDVEWNEGLLDKINEIDVLSVIDKLKCKK